MHSLSLPDINVWLAILLADHVHRDAARHWWESDTSEVVAFIRFTQLGVLRLLTTAAAMNNRPLTMQQAWTAYDKLFTDERVGFLDEPPDSEQIFRLHAQQGEASPKLWADAWLVACAEQSQASLVTFDRALATRAEHALLLG